jgi:hypothetical protein
MYVHVPGRAPTMHFGSDRLHIVALDLGVALPARL